MSEIEKFNELMQDAKRDDDYINATKWAKAFGYRLNNWKELPETKARYNALADTHIFCQSESEGEFDRLKISQSNFVGEKITPWVVERVGRTWVTWIHPIMAVHLASYLDPSFANYVAEIFVRYLKADPHLAGDIASRQETTEGLDIINKAVQERYKFLQGRDWLYASLSKAEMRWCYKRWQLSPKTFTPVLRYVDMFSDYDVIPDFFKDRHPEVYGLMHYYGGIQQEDEYFLLGYFREEIEKWVMQKNAGN
jgi:hypothetical protein